MSRDTVTFATVPQKGAFVPSVPGPKMALPPLLAGACHVGAPAPVDVRTWPLEPVPSELSRPVVLKTTPVLRLLSVTAPVTPRVPATCVLVAARPRFTVPLVP